MIMMEELLTPEDIAKALKISEYTVKELLRKGVLKGGKVSGMWRMRRQDLQAYIENLHRQQEDKK